VTQYATTIMRVAVAASVAVAGMSSPRRQPRSPVSSPTMLSPTPMPSQVSNRLVSQTTRGTSTSRAGRSIRRRTGYRTAGTRQRRSGARPSPCRTILTGQRQMSLGTGSGTRATAPQPPPTSRTASTSTTQTAHTAVRHVRSRCSSSPSRSATTERRRAESAIRQVN
jgi:hypothetical protein